MKKVTKQKVVFGILALGLAGLAQASDDDNGKGCSPSTLRGLYLFNASGFNIVAGVAQPKAIIEYIRFNGDGTLFVPAATRSVNGIVARSAPGGGSYTAANALPTDSACTGTITFTNGPSFDMFIAPKGEDVWMIQTNPDTVLQGTVTKLSD